MCNSVRDRELFGTAAIKYNVRFAAANTQEHREAKENVQRKRNWSDRRIILSTRQRALGILMHYLLRYTRATEARRKKRAEKFISI